MNVLGFEIGVKNAEAGEEIEGLSTRLDKLHEQTERLYEGPARESKIRAEVGAVVKELAIGADPLNAFISTMDRLSETFKFALPLAIGVAAIAGLGEALEKAREKANEWSDSIISGMQRMTDGTEKGVDEAIKIFKKAEEDYDKQGWLERILLGGQRQDLKDIIEEQLKVAVGMKDKILADKTTAEAQSLSGDVNTAAQGKEAEIRLEYHEKILQARIDGEDRYAAALEQKEKAAIDEVEQHRDEKIQEAADKDQEALDKKVEKEREAADRIESEKQHQQQLLAERGTPQDRLAQLQKDIERQKLAVDLAGYAGDMVKEEAERTKLIELQNDQLRLQDEITKKAQQDQEEKNKKQSELNKLLFDELSASEQRTALEAEAARIKAEVLGGKLSDDDKTKDLTRLGQIDKMLNDMTQLNKIGVDSLRQSGGTLGGVNYNIANEAANRAEKQRDDTNKLLTQILGKPDLSRIESF